VNYFKPESILEIGTSLGLATAALSAGNPSANITTLEGCPETAKTAKDQFEKFNFRNVNLVNSEFVEGLSDFRLSSFNLIYFDGNHQKTRRSNILIYFCLLPPTIRSGFSMTSIGLSKWNKLGKS
jgi:predicted O-methyltransferase YrrM